MYEFEFLVERFWFHDIFLPNRVLTVKNILGTYICRKHLWSIIRFTKRKKIENRDYLRS